MKNTLSYIILSWLRVAAWLQLAKTRPMIIGITGSAGKSSAVVALYNVLSSQYRVKYTKKGNSETGIPFEILEIPVDIYHGIEWVSVCLHALWTLLTTWPSYDIFIAEMGIDSEKRPKNMSYLLSIIHPTIGVFLSVNAVHGENFSGDDIVQSIANEKGKLLTSLHESGLAVYSADFPEIQRAVHSTSAKQLTFSSEQNPATLKLVDYHVSLDGTTYTFLHEGKMHTLHFEKQLHFRQAFGTFAAALLIGLELNIPLQTSIELLQKQFHSPPSRLSLIKGIQNSWIIDSSYNSSLGPAEAALEMLGKLQGRKIAVLGDMRELGKQAQPDHERLAQTAAKVADYIFLVGPSTKMFTAPKLAALNFPSQHILCLQHAYEAVDPLKKLIKPGDVILVKGSQNTIFLEIVVKALMAHPEQAKELLARQTPYWEKQRQKLLSK